MSTDEGCSRQSPVSKLFDEINASLSAQVEAIDRLKQRLSPITRVELQPEEETSAEVNLPTDIEKELNQIKIRILEQTERIEISINTLQI